MEQNRTAEQKNKHGSIISKYETTWEHYKVYNIGHKFKPQTGIQIIHKKEGMSVGEKSFIHG